MTSASRAIRPFVLTAAGGFAASALVSAWLMTAHHRRVGVPQYEFLTEASAVALVTLGVALLLGAHRPDHPVTWLLVAAALFGALQVASGVAAHGILFGSTSGGDVAALITAGITQTWSLIATLLLVNLFPTGRSLPGWWRLIPGVLVATAVITVPEQLLVAERHVAMVIVEGPLAGAGATGTVLSAVVGVGIASTIPASIVHVGVRFWRSAGVERQQLKWFFWSLVAAVVVLLPWPGPGLPGWLAWTTAPVLVLGAVALAILRYRLYEIDRVISRTASYAVLAVVVGTMFALPVVAIPSLVGGSNDVIIAGSTLAAAALFNPLRRRIQHVVDRRFNRARYDADREVGALSQRLRSEPVTPEVAALLGHVVQRTVAPAAVAVWIREPT